MTRLYDTDFTAWADETARLLVERQFEAIDREALIEEVERLAARERTMFRSHLASIIEPLLKLSYAPVKLIGQHGSDWQQAAGRARREAAVFLEANASAATEHDNPILSAYSRALRQIQRDSTDFDYVECPPACPWQLDQLLDHEFWPEQLGEVAGRGHRT